VPVSDPRSVRNAFELAERATISACCAAVKQAARRFNQKQSYANRVPVEILGTVLELLSSSDRWTAAIVCQYWRHTALAHRALWTDIECVVSAQGIRPSLSTAVERARGLPLYLSVRFIDNFSDLEIVSFFHSFDLWTPSVKTLRLHFEPHIMYAYDDDDNSEDDDEDDDDSSAEESQDGLYVLPAAHATLGHALSSASIPQLECLELVNIPFELHPQRVPLLHNLISWAGVVLECDGSSIPLATLRAGQLSIATSETPMLTVLSRSCALQQLDITPCMSALSMTLKLDIDHQPFASLRYLRWPGIYGVNRGAAVGLIRTSSDRCWTHCIFPCGGYDETDRRYHPLFESERLSFVVESLPSGTVSELHVQSAPGSAGTFGRLVTTSGSQWLLPNIGLRSDEVQIVCQRIAGSLVTATIPTSKFTLFDAGSCEFPRLTSLLIELNGFRQPGKFLTTTSRAHPVLLPQPEASSVLLNHLWILPKLETLHLKIADSTAWIWARRITRRMPLNGLVSCEAAWAEWSARVTAFTLSELLIASLKPGLPFTLVLHGIDMLEADRARFSCARIEQYMPARELAYEIPAVFAHDAPAYGMYASLARSSEFCRYGA